jgi:hypothetical protein
VKNKPPGNAQGSIHQELKSASSGEISEAYSYKIATITWTKKLYTTGAAAAGTRTSTRCGLNENENGTFVPFLQRNVQTSISK